MPDITYTCPGGPLPAYLAAPAGAGPWPGVVIIQDALGMTADIRRIADRFAASGYLAIVPALYGRGTKLACVVRTMRAVKAGRGAAVDDIVAARSHLAADERCTGRVGIIGFCMGGEFCLLLAAGSTFDAAAPNYGTWPKDRAALRDACPIVASYGAQDRMLPGAAARLEEILTEGDVPHDVKEYPRVGHSFMNDWRFGGPLQVVERILGVQYSAPEAEDAWRRILAFFAIHLDGPEPTPERM